jgi:hypothetical protein
MFSEQSKINCARSLDMLQVTFFFFFDIGDAYDSDYNLE